MTLKPREDGGPYERPFSVISSWKVSFLVDLMCSRKNPQSKPPSPGRESFPRPPFLNFPRSLCPPPGLRALLSWGPGVRFSASSASRGNRAKATRSVSVPFSSLVEAGTLVSSGVSPSRPRRVRTLSTLFNSVAAASGTQPAPVAQAEVQMASLEIDVLLKRLPFPGCHRLSSGSDAPSVAGRFAAAGL